jgi:hypothetical protein
LHRSKNGRGELGLGHHHVAAAREHTGGSGTWLEWLACRRANHAPVVVVGRVFADALLLHPSEEALAAVVELGGLGAEAPEGLALFAAEAERELAAGGVAWLELEHEVPLFGGREREARQHPGLARGLDDAGSGDAQVARGEGGAVVDHRGLERAKLHLPRGGALVEGEAALGRARGGVEARGGEPVEQDAAVARGHHQALAHELDLKAPLRQGRLAQLGGGERLEPAAERRGPEQSGQERRSETHTRRAEHALSVAKDAALGKCSVRGVGPIGGAPLVRSR